MRWIYIELDLFFGRILYAYQSDNGFVSIDIIIWNRMAEFGLICGYLLVSCQSTSTDFGPSQCTVWLLSAQCAKGGLVESQVLS